jgi:hypothetical protein
MAGGAHAPDDRHPAVYEAVRRFMRWCENEFGIQPTYPIDKVGATAGECYGYASQCRFTVPEWHAWDGWCGHQNVPENTHWDPGGIPWDALMGNAPIVELPDPEPPPSEDDLFVKKGHTGPKVQYWQLRLLRLNAGALPRYGADGDYGSETAAAVAAAVPGSDGQQIGPVEAEALDAVPGPPGPPAPVPTGFVPVYD